MIWSKLFEIFISLGDEIYDLMCHVWGGEGYESLMNHYSEEVTNKILDDSYKYLKDLGFTG